MAKVYTVPRRRRKWPTGSKRSFFLASVLQAASPRGIKFFSAVVTSVFTGQDSVFNTKSCVAASFRFPVASARLALAYKDPQGRNTISSQHALFTETATNQQAWPRRTP